MTYANNPQVKLQELSKQYHLETNSIEFANKLDELDPLAKYRTEFIIPKKTDIVNKENIVNSEEESIYLCSNSLGLQPKKLKEYINEELDVWATRGVIGHHNHQYNRPWVNIDESSIPLMAEVVGAKPTEVALMATLTSNLHFLLTAFYKPTQERYKILLEDKAFPSDHYAVESQIKVKGIKSNDAMLLVAPRPGEDILRTEDILNIIKEQGDSISIILLPGVQYYTGQAFNMKEITKAGHEKGCLVGFDLAHAVGNLILELHDWNVDFACWCTYKYLSSGPGNIGGLFVHEKYSNDASFPRLTGWWSHDLKTRFEMTNEMELIPGASGFRHSNPSVLSCMSLYSSLEIYSKAGMKAFREKSLLLTGYLEYLLNNNDKLKSQVKIITPINPEERGCQLSLIIDNGFDKVFDYLCNKGIVCDERKPNCIRVGPYPLINRFSEIFTFVKILVDAIEIARYP